MSKIIGVPVGTPLPKPDWNETNPRKGSYIKNKPDVLNGKDGLTPYIGENGNWWIGDTDTGVSATVDTTEIQGYVDTAYRIQEQTRGYMSNAYSYRIDAEDEADEAKKQATKAATSATNAEASAIRAEEAAERAENAGGGDAPSGGGGYKLLQHIVTTERVSSILVNTEAKTPAFYRIRMYVPKVAEGESASGNSKLFVNGNKGLANFKLMSSGSNHGHLDAELSCISNSLIFSVFCNGAGVDAATTKIGHLAESSISSIEITAASNLDFPIGTEFYLWELEAEGDKAQ